MRRETVIAVLLCLNLALAAGFALMWKQRPQRSTTAPLEGPAPVTKTIAPTAPLSEHSSRPAVTSSFSWRDLESPDYKQYIANLRSVGCPEQTIQDIIVAAVNKQYGARELALNLRPEYAKPWDVAAWSGASFYQKQRQMRELVAEKRALLKELLGVDVPMETPALYARRNSDKFEAAFAALPETKRILVRTIQESFWDKSDALQQRTRGFWEPEDLQERKRLQKECQEALTKVLTDDELANFEMATSPTGSALRAQLAAFEPTDQELRDIFRLRKQLDEDLDLEPAGADSRVPSWERTLANRQLDQQIRSVLGEKRFAEYQRSQDSTFRNLADIAQQDGLPKDSAIKAYEAQKLAREEAAKVRTASGLSPDQRQETLKAMQAELDKALVQLLGDRGFQSYQRGGGARLNYDRRRPTPPVLAPPPPGPTPP